MLKYIEYRLSEPICECKKEHVSWGLGDEYLKFTCKICGVVLAIPRKGLMAYVTFDKDYPEGRVSKKSNILTLIKK